MAVLLAVILVLLLAAILGPQWWVGHVVRRHGSDRPDLPGTGGELARHLLDEWGLKDVKIETTDGGDHYDPQSRTVRLLPQHHDGRSISAVAIAAHEVSHALQHARGERAFAMRFDLVRHLGTIDRLATVILLMAPLVFIFVKAPLVLLLQVAAGLLLLGIHVVVHVATLPVEFDASFRKALPILEHGRYLRGDDLFSARKVLSAAAWTYVAAALVTLLNVARLLRTIRV